jgi:hypothetical protein
MTKQSATAFIAGFPSTATLMVMVDRKSFPLRMFFTLATYCALAALFGELIVKPLLIYAKLMEGYVFGASAMCLRVAFFTLAISKPFRVLFAYCFLNLPRAGTNSIWVITVPFGVTGMLASFAVWLQAIRRFRLFPVVFCRLWYFAFLASLNYKVGILARLWCHVVLQKGRLYSFHCKAKSKGLELKWH